MIAECPFGDLGPLVDKNLKPPALWIGIALCRLGLSWSPFDIHPEDAPILREGPPLLLGMTDRDLVIPPEQGRRLAERAPRARGYVSTFAPHAALIRDDPAWRAAVTEMLEKSASGF